MRVVLSLALSLIFFSGIAISQEGSANFIWAKVVSVQDGDSITILTDHGKTERVQLAYVDAPDQSKKTGKTQSFHKEAKQAVELLTLNKDLIIESFGKDKFGRIEGMVFLDKLNVNLELVRRGFAEIYHPVRRRPARYKKYYVDRLFYAEGLAKEEKEGIWSDPSYISPYQFRRQGK